MKVFRWYHASNNVGKSLNVSNNRLHKNYITWTRNIFMPYKIIYFYFQHTINENRKQSCFNFSFCPLAHWLGDRKGTSCCSYHQRFSSCSQVVILAYWDWFQSTPVKEKPKSYFKRNTGTVCVNSMFIISTIHAIRNTVITCWIITTILQPLEPIQENVYNFFTCPWC